MIQETGYYFAAEQGLPKIPNGQCQMHDMKQDHLRVLQLNTLRLPQ
jgi:hypothetical protein